MCFYTDAEISLHTLQIKYYNDLLDRQNSGQRRNEVTCFSVGEVFCIYLGSLYADFQEKNLPCNVWVKVPNFSLQQCVYQNIPNSEVSTFYIILYKKLEYTYYQNENEFMLSDSLKSTIRKEDLEARCVEIEWTFSSLEF